MNSESMTALAERMGWKPDPWADHMLGQRPYIDQNEEVMIFEGDLTDAGAFRVMVELRLDLANELEVNRDVVQWGSCFGDGADMDEMRFSESPHKAVELAALAVLEGE